jgi:hypothetical protein
MNYQHYNKEEFLKEFSQTKIFKKLSGEYQHLYSDISDVNGNIIRPSHRVELEESSTFLYSIFYYIKFLTEINPTVIADVGCGRNFLKKYIDNVIGFDQTPEADVFSLFDDEFIDNNFQKFDAAIAINSIHFISLKEFANRINSFGKIIKPGGRGFVTCNLIRMMERTEPHEYAELFDLSDRLTTNDYFEHIKKEIKKINYKVIVKDIPFQTDYISKQKKRYELCKGADWPPFELVIDRNYNNAPEHIIKEINSFSIFDTTEVNYDDVYNGNIRIVFEV